MGAAFSLALGLTLILVAPRGARADTFSDSAQAFAKVMIEDGVKTLTVKDLDRAERIERARAFMRRYADMTDISRFALGRYWNRATPAEQTEFVRLFEDYLIQAYVGGLEGFNSEQIKFLGASDEDASTAVVHARIDEAGGEATRVDIMLRSTGDSAFRVTDFVVDGVSIATAKKSEFATVLRQSAGSVEGLLGVLRKKVESLQRESK